MISNTAYSRQTSVVLHVHGAITSTPDTGCSERTYVNSGLLLWWNRLIEKSLFFLSHWEIGLPVWKTILCFTWAVKACDRGMFCSLYTGMGDCVRVCVCVGCMVHGGWVVYEVSPPRPPRRVRGGGARTEEPRGQEPGRTRGGHFIHWCHTLIHLSGPAQEQHALIYTERYTKKHTVAWGT